MYDQVWCVFDRDDFGGTFNEAIEKAKKKGFRVAYSNEAFELWYLLHFIYFDTAIGRVDYIRKLNEHLDKEYSKNSEVMFDILLTKMEQAIRNASTLIESYSTRNPNRNNPSTTVHELVIELNKYYLN